MRLTLAMFVAYLIGSIPTGYLLARFTKNIDIRRYGSGNIGATNILRSMGKAAAFFTLLIDILKGFVVVSIWSDMAYSFRMNVNYPEYVAIMGICVVIGHNYSLFLDFKGGKGVATSIGVILALCPKLLAVGLCAWLLVFTFSKIVSLSSVISAIVIPLGSYYFDYPNQIRFLVIILSILIIISHRSNLRRIARREEHRWSVKI